jgi:MEMO1 family protein
MSTRAAAVAGTFYERDEGRLRQQVRLLLEAARQRDCAAPKALIVPHAGYIYSGATAAEAYRQLLPVAGQIRRVILLGPAHRVYLEGVAIPSVNSFTTPLGEVPLAAQLLSRLREYPAVNVLDEAHREEHSLEVHLPFLQSVLGQFSLLPLVVGHCSPEVLGAIIDELWGGNETLFVISSDLSHFLDYETARKKDGSTCERILQGDTDLSGDEACGAAPINGLLASANGAQLSRELLAYCNSGDTSGDKHRVVGYGSFLLS